MQNYLNIMLNIGYFSAFVSFSLQQQGICEPVFLGNDSSKNVLLTSKEGKRQPSPFTINNV